MYPDSRLKYVLTYYAKASDDLAGEVEIAPLVEADLRDLLKVRSNDRLVDVYPVPAGSVAILARGSDHAPDPQRYDYYFEAVVRAEFVATFYASETPPYPAPETLRAFPDAKRVRSKTDTTS